MESFEINTQSFVVRVWLEGCSDQPTWRGHITHVPSHRRRYVDSLDGITDFIATYLNEMGVDSDQLWSGLHGWLRQHGV